MSATQTATRTGVAPAPAEKEPYYSNRPNARPQTEEAVPSAEWTRWRLYKQRPDIKDKFPEYFPDVRKQLYDRLNAEVQADKERIPIPPKFRKRSLEELKEDYTPTQLGFAPLTDFYDEVDRQNARLSRRQRIDSDEEGDRIPSLWFERMAQDLFARVWEFCSDTFGVDASLSEEDNLTGKLNDYDWTLRWLDKLPKEFVVLASQVARGDMTVVKAKNSDPTNWEFLFLDPKSRVKLMVGVMAKLLEKNLFNSLLVGAADVEKTALEADDHARAFLENSYQRNRTRSETVRNYIQANRPPYGIGLVDLWTDNFWDEVDSVTMGILDLLLPLINLLGHDMPKLAWPPLKQIHQGLHDIVAEAAWFTNGMRATRSVFWIQFPLAGELSDISHDHAIADIWDRSKVNAEARDRENWDEARDKELAKKHKNGITQEHRAAYEAKNPRPYIRRTAKVQVAMWPFIKRFSPMGEKDAGDGAYNNGETITQIMKAQCVYYYGADADAVDMDERRTLSEQISGRQVAKWFTLRAFLIYALIFGLFLLVTSPEFQQELDRHSHIGKSSSSSQGFERETKTTTIVAVPVGTEIVTQTVVVTDTRGDEDRSWFKYRGPTVTTVTETVTETLIKEVNGRADDDDDDTDEDHDSDEDSESSDDENDDRGSGYVSKGKGIAASLVSAKDKVNEGMVSAKDYLVSEKDSLASEFASTTDRLAASASSEREKLASIASSVRESVINSMADEQSSISAASQRSADESSSSVAASKSSVSESRASKEASRSSERASRDASRSSADASKSSSRSSAKEAKSSSRQSKESSKSSVAAQKSAEAEAKKLAAAETSLAAERSAAAQRSAAAERSAAAVREAAEMDRIVSEKVAATLAAEEEARRIAASIASEEEEKTSSSSSSASKKRAGSRKTAAKGSGTDTTTLVTSAGYPVSVEDLTTGEVSMLTEEEKETITITVPADKVVVTVTGPVTQVETKGAVKTAVDKANIFAEGWRYVTECYYTSWSFWKFIRYVWTQFIGPNPFLIFFVLLLFALGAKKLFDDRLRADGPAIGG